MEEERRRSPAELNEPVLETLNDQRPGIEMDNIHNAYSKRDYDLESVRSYHSNVNLINSNRQLHYNYPDGSVYDGYPSSKHSEAGYINDARSAYAGTLGRQSVYSPTVDGMTVDGMTVGTESILDGNEERPFTVERKDIDSHMHRWYKKPSRALSLLKFIIAMVLAMVTLFCVVASKLTIIAIAKAFENRKPNLTDITGRHNTFICNLKIENSTHIYLYNSGHYCSREVVFVMLSIILMVPPAVTLIKLFVRTCRKITHPWPTKLAILWGAIGTLLESAGLSLFFVGLVSNVMDTDIILILMNALFIIPVISQFTKEFKSLSSEREMELSANLYEKRRKIHIQNVVLSAVAFVFQAGGIVGILYLLNVDEKRDYERLIIIPVSIALISLGWSPKIRKLQIDHDLAYVWSDTSDEALEQTKLPKAHRVRYFRESEKRGDVNDAASTISTRTADIRQKKKKTNLKDDARKVVVQTNTSRGKATLINCLIKLMAIPVFMTFFVYLFEVADITQTYQGFVHIAYDNTLFGMFILHMVVSFIGYHTAWVGCMITLQRLCFAIPLTLATPICIVIVLTDSCQIFGLDKCNAHLYGSHSYVVALLSIAIWLGQFFATTYYAWKSQDFVMAEEATLFWVPTYDGTLLEQSILLNRKNEATNEFFVNYRTLVKRSHVYICTTMYHEADYEMEQLLFSIAGVDRARRSQERMFECHIWFDDGVRDKTLKTFAIQLISLLPHTVQVDSEDAVKLSTPYGMELKWTLPGGMPFNIHLKDNFKVKNKKRWSQVMYMSYVLDYRERGNQDYSYILTTDADVKFHPEDVTALMDFMSRDPSVGAVCGRTHPMGSGPLVWYQIFDYAIGHWLLKVAEHVMGSVLCSPGCFSVYRCRALQDILPQYASSVECALDFLTKDMGEDRWLCTLMIERGWRLDYCASSKDTTYCPEEFNEFFKQRRRWGPSTLANQALLIQRQGKIRQSNDDINLMFVVYQVLMLVSTIIGPGTVILLVASGLNAAFPSLISLTQSFFVNFFLVLFYVWVCLYYKQDTQLHVAQLLTFVYSMIMTITIVGLMVQIADDIAKQRFQGFDYFVHNGTDTKYPFPPTVDKETIFDNMTVSLGNGTLYNVSKVFVLQLTPPTLFLFFLITLFMTTAILHGGEAIQLVHGMWYLLCLPSGYIFLMVYSLVNITDRSWGTRESAVKKNKVNTDQMAWYHQLWFKFREVFFCCFKEERDKIMGVKIEQDTKVTKITGGDDDESENDEKEEKEEMKRKKNKKNKNSGTTDEQKGLLSNDVEDEEDDEEDEEIIRITSNGEEEHEIYEGGELYPEDEGGVYMDEHLRQSEWLRSHNHTRKFQSQRRRSNTDRQRNNYVGNIDYDHAYGNGYNQNGVYIGDADSDVSDYYITMNIEDWLDGPYAIYIKRFKDTGYDDTTFLMGMKEPDLIEVGIDNRGHRKKILAEIDRLPPEDIDQDVPEDVHEWLMILGLQEYWPLFEKNSYSEPNALADLKLMDIPTLSSTFEMSKPGHIRKLTKAIKQLKYPTTGQRKIRQAKLALEKVPILQLAEESPDEYMFWDKLRKICLLTEQGAFSQSEELHSKLFELRNAALVIFSVCNILWLVIMMALLSQGKKLTVLNSNFLSVAFLVIYAVIMIIQFCTLLIHRVTTWMHFVARTPFKPGSSKNKSWSFQDDDIYEEPAHEEMEEAGEVIAWNLRRRSMRRTIQAKERAEFFMNGPSFTRAAVHEMSY